MYSVIEDSLHTPKVRSRLHSTKAMEINYGKNTKIKIFTFAHFHYLTVNTHAEQWAHMSNKFNSRLRDLPLFFFYLTKKIKNTSFKNFLKKLEFCLPTIVGCYRCLLCIC